MTNIVDSHFHWWPRPVLDAICERTTYPRAEPDGKGGYRYMRYAGANDEFLNAWAEWFTLDDQLAYMDALGRHVDVIGSTGPLSVHFSSLPASEGREAAIQWNEQMAFAQRTHPGRFFGSAAVPLVDTAIAIEVLDDAVHRLGLRGVNLPGSVGADPRIDHERLEPFYDRVEQLGQPLFLHPTDAVFADMLAQDYGNALYYSLGRVMEVSVCAARLIFSGIMERHPDLIVVMSHTGGALPYQAGRLDKNGGAAGLHERPSTYLKRMYTDTVQPLALGMKFAVDFFGADHVMYGSDYPCWRPEAALQIVNELGLSDDDRSKILSSNVRRLFELDRLGVPAVAGAVA
jgi:aminocarboxymuconate-semialdehyde decarboxylase